MGMTSESKGQSDNEQQPVLVLAKWSTRFWAWLVDFIIVITVTEIIFSIAYPPLAFNQGMQDNPGLGTLKWAVQSALFLGYWSYFESKTGQSIGKKLLKIKSTDLVGKRANVKSVIIQSFGKAFLLPIDVLLGWIFTNDKRQRLLSRAASTIVVRSDDSASENISYKKD